uniref:hypothetical protein n=1 Tax=Pseudomonas mohnii TaxID=395600 RepID=UPI001A7EECC1
MLYGRQEIRVPNRLSTLQQIGYAIVCVLCELSVHCVFTHRNLAFRRKLLGCYMVKPHGQLVLVSSTPH